MTISEHKIIETNKLKRLPPNDEKIEIIIIACLLKSEKARNKINRIENDDFYYKENKDYFILLKNYIRSHPIFDIYTVPEKTQTLINYYTRPDVLVSNFDLYLKRLKEVSNLRKLERIAYDIAVKCQENKNFIEIRNQYLDKLNEIKPHDLKDIINIEEADADFDNILDYDFKKNITTGFIELDKKIGGFQPSGLYAIGGVPAAGKTTFMLNIMQNILRNKKKILFVSLEMSYREIINKFISSITGISTVVLRGLRNRKIDMDRMELIVQAREKIKRYELNFVGKGGLSVPDVKDRIEYLGGVDIVFIDYLQLIKPSGGKSRYEQITQISRDLKLLATKFDIPIVFVASINRANMDRLNKRPQLSDFRDSGNIEYDLDCAMLLYRASQFKSDASENEAELILAKNRYGKSNIIFKMEWHPATSEFTNIELKEK